MKQTVRILLFVLGAGTAWAHDTWLLPTRFRVDPPSVLTFHLTSAMAFPEPETAPKAERLAEAKIRIAGETLALEPSAGDRALALTAKVDKAGLGVAWAASRERALELTPEEVVHYLDEVGATDSVGLEWKRSGGKVWRETYVKRAKTFVRVGQAGGDTAWREPVGLDLELVPEKDPTALSVGDSLAVRLLWKGKPLPGLAVAAVGAAPAKAALVKTGADGRASFALSKAGPWLVRSTWIRPSEARPGEWDSVFTTLTVEVRPR